MSPHGRKILVCYLIQVSSSINRLILFVNSCFYHLRRLAKVKTFLSLKNFEIVIHSFITSRLDYCNSTLLWS